MKSIFIIVKKTSETYGHGDFGESYKIAMTNAYDSPPTHPAFATKEKALEYISSLGRSVNYEMSVMEINLIE